MVRKRIRKNKYVIPFIIVSAFFIILLSLFFSKYKYVNKIATDKAAAIKTGQNKPMIEKTNIPLAPTKSDSLSNITISSAGDCTLGTDDTFSYDASLPAMIRKQNNDFSYFFKNMVDIFKNSDISTVNLETALTNSNSKVKKPGNITFNFKGKPEYSKILTLGSINAVNISNNHIYDYGSQGLLDTITSLKSENINFFGENNKWITEKKGVKFGFIGYMGFSDDSRLLSKIKKDIQDLKKQNCIVIINFHWGSENYYIPNEVQKHIAHYAIDNGADLIIGHHPHVIQGLEQYKGKFICYSLGNFCFGGNNNPSDKDAYIFQAMFKFKNNTLVSTGIRVIPCSISSMKSYNDYCPTPMTGDKKQAFINKLTTLSPKLNLKLDDNFTFLNIIKSNVDVKN